jgi:hypothetical protein
MYRHIHMHVLYVWGTFISECMYVYIYAAQGMTVKIAYTQTMSNQYNYLKWFFDAFPTR